MKWLDSIIALQKNRDYEVDGMSFSLLSLYSAKEIHVSNAHIIADAIGVTPIFEKREDDESYPYTVHFMYKGYKFFCLMSKEEYENIK
jgi:hypothetical protein